MKVLVLHNRYRQSGGEDSVVRSEEQMLSAAGHMVLRYERDNHELPHTSDPRFPMLLSQASLAADTIWARRSYHDVLRITRHGQADVAHFHNTLPLISPSAYWACRKNAIPVVQTLHNYRLLCPAATFLRRGAVCELCRGKAIPWPAVVHACYRNSRAASGVVAAMLATHRAMQTWTRTVDVFIALSEFAKAKFVEGGLPAAKIKVKPNFVYPDPGIHTGNDHSDFTLFVGRLSEEKGLRTLIEAWRLLGNRIPLRIIGDGPLHSELRTRARLSNLHSIHFDGRVPRERVIAAMKHARFLIMPSECYENFPMAIAETFACGTPVIASNRGAPAEIVEDGRTGMLFQAGNPADLAARVECAWEHPAPMKNMGFAARSEFEAKYTAERNLRMLVEIYGHAIASSAREVAPVCADA